MEWLTFKATEREPAFRGQVFVKGLAVRKEEISYLEEIPGERTKLVLKNGQKFELAEEFDDVVRRLDG